MVAGTNLRGAGFRSGLVVLAAAVIVFLSLVSPCRAETIVLKNGSSYTGKIISIDDKEVVFEIHKYGAKIKRTFQVDRIKEILEDGQAPKTAATSKKKTTRRSKPTKSAKVISSRIKYMVIPLKGALGKEVVDDVFKQCLKTARNKKANVIILEIDSPGGAIRELSAMFDTLRKFKDMRIVAYVKHGISAAGLLSVACKEIILSPNGTLGGAVIWKLSPDGTPTNINEKFESIFRAKFRSEAVSAGHNPLLIEGMMQTDVALCMVRENGKTRVVRGQYKRNSELLKAKGKILTLDSAQAVACGLALGTAENVDKCNTLLGIDEWHRMKDSAKFFFTAWNKKIKNAEQQFHQAMQQSERYIRRAEASDPSRGRYWVSYSSEKLTASSKKKWLTRASTCRAFLKKSQKELSKASSLLKKYPQLGFSKKKIDERIRLINTLRETIADDKKRRGI